VADATGNDGCACDRGGCRSESEAGNFEEAAARRRCGLNALRLRETGLDAIFDARGRCCRAESPKGFVDAAVVILAGVCDV
jgi:hypothetical protein